jgi:hypothetical protein
LKLRVQYANIEVHRKPHLGTRKDQLHRYKSAGRTDVTRFRESNFGGNNRSRIGKSKDIKGTDMARI